MSGNDPWATGDVICTNYVIHTWYSGLYNNDTKQYIFFFFNKKSLQARDSHKKKFNQNYNKAFHNLIKCRAKQKTQTQK